MTGVDIASYAFDPPELTARTFALIAGLKPPADKPDLIRAIAEAFARIPYENITKILKRHGADPHTRLRGPLEVLNGFRERGTGGTCFSLVHCLRTILAGFSVECYVVMADMPHGPDIHCAVIAPLEDRKILLDPGYLIPYPVTLPPAGGAVRSRNYMNQVEYRVRPDGVHIDLYTINQHLPKWRYCLKDRPTPETEFLAFWQLSFEQTMMNSLILTRAGEGGQLYLHNDRLRLIRQNEKRNQRLRENYEYEVESLFGVRAELVRDARAILREQRQEENA